MTIFDQAGLILKLSKSQREQVRLKYNGHCSYCGNLLQEKWHADHLVAVQREGRWERGVYVQTGKLSRPQHDHLANMMPACVPCNIDKSDASLDAWRKRLERSAETLRTNYSTYRHALRFKLIAEAAPRVVFHFEQRRRIRINQGATS